MFKEDNTSSSQTLQELKEEEALLTSFYGASIIPKSRKDIIRKPQTIT